VVIDTTAPVVVIHRGGYGDVAVARTLGRLGIAAYLVAQQGMSTPIWSSRYWVKRTRWDFSRSEDESVAFLLELGAAIQATHGRRAILLTLADWVAVFLERHGTVLHDQFVYPHPQRSVVHTLLNKWSMHGLAQEHRIPTPVTAFPVSLDEADEFLNANGLPIVMKAADPFVHDPPPTKLIRSREDLMLEAGRREAADAPLNMILQEYIPGTVDTVWMCNGYFGADPEHVVTFPGKKLRQVSPAGVASLAVCLPNETVESQTRRFMEGVGYRGCVGIGYRYDRRDGLYKVLDVNARVSGVFRLFAGTNDVDVVRACYLNLTGQEFSATALRPGRRWMLEDDVVAALREIRTGNLTVLRWARSVRRVQELHWMAADDPVPFFVWCADLIRHAGSNLVNRMLKSR
jgi:predicted ATP-grasp superfamily ATP-dependent carboligase